MQAIKVGDRVRILNTVDPGWWFKPGQIATVEKVTDDRTWPYKLRFEEGNKDLTPYGYVNATHIELVKAPTVADDLRITPQARTVLRHLKKHKSISPAEAMIVHGITRLASCIHEIRHRAGYGVQTELRKDDHGHKYASYALAVVSTVH